jgi:long-subunit acyl-CoA synthetase (AMP-forming)
MNAEERVVPSTGNINLTVWCIQVVAGKPRGSFWDKKIFSKIQDAFGEGSIKTMASGAAPLSADLQNWVTVRTWPTT